MTHEKSSAPALRQIDLFENDGGNHRGLPTIGQIDAYMEGSLPIDDLVTMFRGMIASGAVWHLFAPIQWQSYEAEEPMPPNVFHYTAASLLSAELVQFPKAKE